MNLSTLIKKNLAGKQVLLFFIASTIVYAIMLTVTIPEVMLHSQGMKLFDLMPFGYDHEYATKFLHTLGETGRHAYLFRQLPLDLIYPLLFAASSCLILAWFLNKLNKLESPLFYLCYIPLIAEVFDYGENIGIITMLNNYPDNSRRLTQITNVCTVIKSSLVSSYFIMLAIVLIAVLVSRFLKK